MALQTFSWVFTDFQFLNPIQSRQDSLDGGSARRKTFMPRVVSEPTIPAFEREGTVHALDRAALWSANGSIKKTPCF
jgi:hypothetical protein